mmetsp:Transcript_56381/g.132212  ORF Transcript_56381/g.132212 Transcript_56381/m.132212 type:complete len:680 (+) Transcript_56381:173-2212(+)
MFDDDSDRGDVGQQQTKSEFLGDESQFAARVSHRRSTLYLHPLINSESAIGRLVSSWHMEVGILALIVLNALWLAVEIDQMDSDADTLDAPDFVNSLFCILFLGELLLRFLAYRKFRYFFTDSSFWMWNVFDTLLVFSMAFETWLLPLFLSSGQEVMGLSVLRLFRLLRVARLLRFLPELAFMVKALIASLRSVSTTVVLAIGIMYVFAIVMTQWAREKNKDEATYDYFGTIPNSFLTLFQILCFDECFAVIRLILRKSPGHGAVLLLYIVVVPLTVLNMLIGVICKLVAETNYNERRRLLHGKVATILKALDYEQTGQIPSIEVNNANALEAFETIGVDERLLCDALEVMEVETYSLVDVDQFAETIKKLLSEPESQDVVLLQRKLDKLETVLLDLIDQDQKAVTREEKDEMVALTRCADDIEKWLETLAKSVLEATGGWYAKKLAMEPEERAPEVVEAFELIDVDTVDESAGSGTGGGSGMDDATGFEGGLAILTGIEESQEMARPQLDLELIRLNDSMERLRLRLVRWAASGATSTTSMLGRGASSEFFHWQRTCSEVSSSITAFQTLLKEFLGEQEEPVLKKKALIPGAMVRLQDLDTEMNLNGQLAQLRRWHDELGRWAIVFHNGQEKLAKPSNLQACPDETPWELNLDSLDKNGLHSSDAEDGANGLVFRVAT